MNPVPFPFSNHTRKNYFIEFVIFIRLYQQEIENGIDNLLIFYSICTESGEYGDIGVFFLLTYNMLYEIVRRFQSNRLNLTIVRSFGTDFPLPQTERFSFFDQ